jgi:preprotein translocase subunit SecF
MQPLTIDEVANDSITKNLHITIYSICTYVLMAAIILFGGHIGFIYRHTLILDVKVNINLKMFVFLDL